MTIISWLFSIWGLLYLGIPAVLLLGLGWSERRKRRESYPPDEAR